MFNGISCFFCVYIIVTLFTGPNQQTPHTDTTAVILEGCSCSDYIFHLFSSIFTFTEYLSGKTINFYLFRNFENMKKVIQFNVSADNMTRGSLCIIYIYNYSSNSSMPIRIYSFGRMRNNL